MACGEARTSILCDLPGGQARRGVYFVHGRDLGVGMSALPDTTDHAELCDIAELGQRLAEYQLRTSDGRPHEDPERSQHEACWVVVLSTDGLQVRRDIWLNHKAWEADDEQWQPEGVIWPTWPARPADEVSSPDSALSGVQEYWTQSGDRLRDSAKWMATVVGAALAILIGTSPLALIKGHHFSTGPVIVGAVGLLSLGVTLFLIVQVMRPQAVSFTDVQSAKIRRSLFASALGRWRETVESHQDMYLPCGVRCLTSLRQSMIIEKMTLMALALAHEQEAGRKMHHELEGAQAARAARLVELRGAAARVAIIGEYYALRRRSTWATYAGILCGLIGTASIIAAFAWPPA